MNNPFVQEQAAGLARRLIAASSDPTRRIETGLSTGMVPPTHVRMSASRARNSCERLDRPSPAGACRRSRAEAWTSLAKVMLTANEFLYID